MPCVCIIILGLPPLNELPQIGLEDCCQETKQQTTRSERSIKQPNHQSPPSSASELSHHQPSHSSFPHSAHSALTECKAGRRCCFFPQTNPLRYTEMLSGAQQINHNHPYNSFQYPKDLVPLPPKPLGHHQVGKTRAISSCCVKRFCMPQTFILLSNDSAFAWDSPFPTF